MLDNILALVVLLSSVLIGAEITLQRDYSSTNPSLDDMTDWLWNDPSSKLEAVQRSIATAAELSGTRGILGSRVYYTSINSLSHELLYADGMSDRRDCITALKISAMTGKRRGAGFSTWGGGHCIVLQLRNGQQLQGIIRGPAYHNWPYTLKMNFASDFRAENQCVKHSDISQVSLIPGGDDNWYITKITTYVKVGTEPYIALTNDPTFNKWLDGKNVNTAKLVLTQSSGIEHAPLCNHGTPVCECKPEADTCIFNLEIDEIRTFTSYRKIPIGSEYDVQDTHGVVYSIGADGEQRPLEQHKERYCAKQFNSANCSEPQFVDGKTYRMAIGVNGQIPGPTIIVHEEQRVVIHVHNNLTTDGISIHWHGLHQFGIPWMDGVGQLTQCQIDASSSFSYVYKASPSGTFWYHSHSGTQRIDGLFGGLIVKDKPQRLKIIKSKLLVNHGVKDFQDLPGKHTITLLDWQQESSLDLLTRLTSGLGFYPDIPIGEVPPSDVNSVYKSTLSYEHSAVGAVPYFSGLINGIGRHRGIPYAKSRLSVFIVERGNGYRFRLIGAQNHYAYKFSIDGHKLTVVGTDGYWLEPEKKVDYIIIHSGERYDFILEADAKFSTGDYYWIRAETLEIDIQSNGGKPPYKSLGHMAEALLQYTEKGALAPEIHSTQYESIKLNSKPRDCLRQGCKAVNCPFQAFHPSYNIECVNVHKLRLLEETPRDQLPQALPSRDCDNCLHFINFGFEGESGTSSANGRNLILPPVPPLTQNEDFQKQAFQCSHTTDCDPFTPDCKCTYVIDIPYRETVQFVFTAMGGELQPHPIHLHGHSFHVVHMGYPEYNQSTGFLIPSYQNLDIQCRDTCQGRGCNPRRCTKPSWKNNRPPPSLSINPYTVRKDTVIVPAGGYAVINYISDNPGHWFLHCHIEAHQYQGMGLFVNEAFSQQQNLQIPKSMNKCGNVDYKRKH